MIQQVPYAAHLVVGHIGKKYELSSEVRGLLYAVLKEFGADPRVNEIANAFRAYYAGQLVERSREQELLNHGRL